MRLNIATTVPRARILRLPSRRWRCERQRPERGAGGNRREAAAPS